MDARSAREWSSEAAARAICPNSLRRRCCINEETGGWSVCDRTDTLVTCAVYGTRRIRRRHHWSKASRRCRDASKLTRRPQKSATALSVVLVLYMELDARFFYSCLCPAVIGGGSYWAGRAAARPLFGLRGPQICLARPLLAT